MSSPSKNRGASAGAPKPSIGKKAAAAASDTVQGKRFKLAANRTKQPSSPKFAQKAVFLTHICTYQKGDNLGDKTGNMQIQVRGSGANAELHAGLSSLLLDQTLRFDDLPKLFKARVYSKAQAAKILNAMQGMYPGPNEDLPTSIDDCEWNEDTAPQVGIVPTLDTKTSPPTDIVLLDSTKGSLYPIKEKVKPFGFTYVRDFNGIPGADYWVAPATGLDTEALAALLDDWGWAATIYDGAD
tara:strand:+ start:1753 stop:2475 length:723 start_codon:yes stop_codon:yes gene_type:complete